MLLQIDNQGMNIKEESCRAHFPVSWVSYSPSCMAQCFASLFFIIHLFALSIYLFIIILVSV